MKYWNALFGVIAILICGGVSAAPLDISGTYEVEVSYGQELPRADRRWFFGTNPDIEFTFTQKGDKIKGKFSGDREGDIKGKIDDEEVTFEFYLEALGGEIKDGAGTWIVEEDGTLKGDFKIRDQQRGVVRGRWTLTKIDKQQTDDLDNEGKKEKKPANDK